MVQRFERFKQTLTKRQALPLSLKKLRAPYSMNEDTIQPYQSNGLGQRPFSNNAFFPTDPDPDHPIEVAPTINRPLPPWTVVADTGIQRYYQTATGFSGAESYELSSPPAGVTINSITGDLSFDTTAAVAESITITVNARNAYGTIGQTISFVKNATQVAPTIVRLLPSWDLQIDTVESKTYNASIGFTGSQIVYTLQAGATGVSINSSTGVLTCNTSQATAGTYSLTVRATNSAGFVEQTFAFHLAAVVFPAPAINDILAPWTVTAGTGLQVYATAGGFTGQQITYSLVSPPGGVSISSVTGIISFDTAGATAATLSITVKATNAFGFAQQTFSFVKVVALAAPTAVGTLSAWNVQKGTGSQTFNAAVGFTGSQIVYSLQVAAIGVTINASSGLVSVDTVAATAGPYSLVVRATNGAGFADQPLSLVVAAAVVVPPSLGSVLQPWTVAIGSGVQTYQTAAGFTGVVTSYTLDTPKPAGVNINPTTGIITYDTTGAVVSTSQVTVRANNSGGSAAQTFTLSRIVAVVAPVLVGSLSDWNVQGSTGNQTYNAASGFSGAQIVYSLQVGSTGVSINASTGLITADTTVVTAGLKNLTVRATNSAGFVDQPLKLTLTALAVPVVVGTLSNWTETQNTGTKTYNAAVGFNGQQITYSLVSPPAGVTIVGTTGVISCDTATTGIITQVLTVRATNSAGFVNQTLTLTVQAAVLPQAAALVDADFDMLGTMFDPAFPAPSLQQTGVISIPKASPAFNATVIKWGSSADAPMTTVPIGTDADGNKLYRCNSQTGQHMKDPTSFYGGIYVYWNDAAHSLSPPSTSTVRFTVPANPDATIVNFVPLLLGQAPPA